MRKLHIRKVLTSSDFDEGFGLSPMRMTKFSCLTGPRPQGAPPPRLASKGMRIPFGMLARHLKWARPLRRLWRNRRDLPFPQLEIAASGFFQLAAQALELIRCEEFVQSSQGFDLRYRHHLFSIQTA